MLSILEKVGLAVLGIWTIVLAFFVLLMVAYGLDEFWAYWKRRRYATKTR